MKMKFHGKLNFLKPVRIRGYSGPYFPAFGLNTERYSYLCLLSSNAGKYGPEETPYLDTF